MKRSSEPVTAEVTASETICFKSSRETGMMIDCSITLWFKVVEQKNIRMEGKGITIHCSGRCNMLQWVAMLFEGTPYLVDDAEGFGAAV